MTIPRYIRIDGKTNPEQRKLQVDKFQERDDYLAAVLSITAANAGVTLTAAHLVVFTELFWNPGVINIYQEKTVLIDYYVQNSSCGVNILNRFQILCQAEDRVHRIGQNDTVMIQYLVAKNTADDYIWPLIKKKLNVLNAVGLDQDFSINDVDESTEVRKKRSRDITSFLNISSSSEKGSQPDEEPKDFPAVEDKKRHATPKASTSNDLKELLEVDEDYFDSCDWDDM